MHSISLMTFIISVLYFVKYQHSYKVKQESDQLCMFLFPINLTFFNWKPFLIPNLIYEIKVSRVWQEIYTLQPSIKFK